MAYAIISTSPNNATPISTSATVSVVNDSIKVQPLLISADSKVSSAFPGFSCCCCYQTQELHCRCKQNIPLRVRSPVQSGVRGSCEENNQKAMGKFLRGHVDASRHFSVYKHIYRWEQNASLWSLTLMGLYDFPFP